MLRFLHQLTIICHHQSLLAQSLECARHVLSFYVDSESKSEFPTWRKKIEKERESVAKHSSFHSEKTKGFQIIILHKFQFEKINKREER